MKSIKYLLGGRWNAFARWKGPQEAVYFSMTKNSLHLIAEWIHEWFFQGELRGVQRWLQEIPLAATLHDGGNTGIAATHIKKRSKVMQSFAKWLSFYFL